eukprot:CAMPEP_0185828400 /NCGR_PEP_ID=MMETSP1322-20130828/32533_1 /TAXON_ID=265543 /ORGANISM="Minutocellus polymorphus, Strain RCC2270" /LENGTH=498 /DNA_ID=CAMNT_0028526139 /DNA_START=12 /DNA_END=1508 /DNA_ORIENTATION=+
MPQCDLSPNGTHRYVPSPTTLSSVTCLHCHHTKLCTKAKCASKYLKYRRAMQHSRGLRNITVCLEKESVQSLNNVLAEAGVKGKVVYVTLLEGVLPESNEHLADRDAPLVVDQEQLQGQIETVRSALMHHPTITVRKLHKIRRTDRTTDLLLADVTLNPAVSKCLASVVKSDNCVLPQYATYIALGSVSREGRMSVNALKSVRRLLQGRSLEVRNASLQCRPLSSSSASSASLSGSGSGRVTVGSRRGSLALSSSSASSASLSGSGSGRVTVGSRRGSLASHGYGRQRNDKYTCSSSRSSRIPRDAAFAFEYVPGMQYGQEQQSDVPRYRPSQIQPSVQLSSAAAPFKLRYQPKFVRSTSAATADTECEHFSESSDSDNDGVGDDYKLSTPPQITRDVVHVNIDKPMDLAAMPNLTSDAHSRFSHLGSGRCAGHSIGKNPSMDEADLACDLNFLADTPPSSPGRLGPDEVSSDSEAPVGVECIRIVDECRRSLQIIGM